VAARIGGSPLYETPEDEQLAEERVSPSSSSGFSSGSECQETAAAAVKPYHHRDDGTPVVKRPVETARMAAAASRESVLAELEWDDAGIELTDDVMARAGHFWRSEGLENSILRWLIDSVSICIVKKNYIEMWV
jgi:hypothetical protein